jgi:hypothetical protein
MDLWVKAYCVRRGQIALALFESLHDARDYHKALPGNVRRHATIGAGLTRPGMKRVILDEATIREQKENTNNINYSRSHKKHLKTCHECR